MGKSADEYETDPTSLFANPPPVRGKAWKLPSITSLPPIPGGVGYGCFYNANASNGYPLTPVPTPCDPGGLSPNH